MVDPPRDAWSDSATSEGEAMRRMWVVGLLVAGAWLLASPSSAAISVFQDPNNTGPSGAGAAQVPLGGAAVSLNIWYLQTGAATSGAGTVCSTGTGDEVCGWDIYIAGSGGVILQSFTPNPGSDIVANISGNVLRANGGDPIAGEIGPHRLGT